jgi:hypothetical protein
MQNHSPKDNGQPDNSDQGEKNGEINARLVEHIKANAVRIETAAVANRLPSRGIFREAFAVVGLIGLMVVAYFYSRLIDKQA